MLWFDEQFEKDMAAAAKAAKLRFLGKASGVRTYMIWDGEKYEAIVEELVAGKWVQKYPPVPED